MNKIYKVIWSKVKHQYVVVSELAHSNGKQSRTSRNSIRSRIAALVVCGAIAAFGVFSALPNSAYAATAAETTSGQYIAVALADTNEEDVAGQWYNKNSTKFGNDYEWNSLWGRWVECDNTRTFKDATGALHTYTKQTINNKTYWVREGYSISAEEGNRFTAYDEHRNPIAPENTYIIDSQKSDDADDVGLISSSQVVISDDSKHTTLTGNPLNNIEPGIYGGASNGGGTEVPVDYHYYIDNNGKGWVNIGKQEWNDFTNPNSGKGYFQEVYAQKDGSYNTKEDGSGISVSSEYLYAIDKTSTGSSDKSDVKLGAFFNSNGTLYTGNVYGNNNEVLMTGVENGTYYSYWGTKINDLNTSLSEMTVGDLNRIVGGINDTIYTAQGDDIKQVSVQKSQDNNGGTIGLIRRGDWNGTTYSKIDPVPGTITVTSTGGTDGSGANNDVKIKFSNTDEDGTEHSFTVDAGSKVEGLKDGNTANPDDTLTGIKINGETYQLGGGKTYSPGQGIAISDDNKISVDKGDGLEFISSADGEKLKVNANEDKGITVDGSGVAVNAGDGLAFETQEGEDKGKLKVNVGDGLSIADGKVVNNLAISGEVTDQNKNGGNWTITDNKTGVKLTNTTLSSTVDKQSMTGNEYGNTYTISDTDGNTATLEDVASATKLSSVDSKIGELNYSSVTSEDNTIEDNDSVTTAIGKLDNKVNTGWTVADGNTENANFAVKPGETLTFNGDDNVTVEAKDHAVNVSLKDNITLGDKITLSGEDGKATIGGVKINNTYNDENGSITSSTIDGLTNKTWDSTGNYSTSGKAATEAQLQAATDNISGKVNAGWKATAGETSIEVKPTKDEDGNNVVPTLNFAGDDNISVTADNTSSTIKVTLDPTLDVTSVDAKGTTISSAGLTVGGNTYVSSSGINANSKKITNVADGTIEKNSKDAVNAGQLYDVNQKVDAGWTATDGTNDIKVNPKDGTTTLKFAGDNNIAVTADTTNKAIQVALNDKVYLGGDHTEDSHNIVLDGDRGVIGLGSTIALDGRDGKAVIGSINIETVYDEATGKPSSTISGLANTTWDADLAAQGGYANSNKAATEAQIQSAVNQSGWTASTNKNVEGLAAKTDITNGDTVDFSNTDGNISVSQTAVTENGTVTGTDIKFDLNDNISLGDGKITLNGAPAEGEDLLNVDNKLVVAQDGTTTIAVNDGTVMGNNTTVTIGSDGVTFAGYDKGSTIIDGQTIQAGGVFINDGGNGQITRLTNTTLDDPTFATVGRAATEEQLQLATDAATTTVTEGKNIDVTSTVDKEDGHTNYEVKLQDNVVLGDNKITLNGNPGEGEDLLNVDNALVVGQDGTTTIAADNAETMGVDTRVTVNTDGVTFEGLENGSTIIDGQTIQAGGVFINDGGNGQITRLTNTTLDDPTFATVGRAATEEQLQLATDAATTTVSEGKNIDVTSTVDEEDGHTDYEVSLQDNVSLGDGKITLNGAPAEGDDLLNVDNAFVVGQDGTTTITADDAGTMGADTKVTVGTDGVKFEGLENGTTTIDGQTIQAGGVFINDGGNGQITRLTNTTLDDPTFATVGRAATEEQLKQAAAASKTTLSDGVNTTVTSNDNTPDGHVDYQVNLNDNVYLGGNNKPGSSNIELDGENGTIQVGSNIILDSKEARAVIGGVDISTTFDDIGKKSSTITGLSNTTWDTDKVVIDRAATEGQLQMVSDKVTAGWTATDDAGNKINVNPETRPTLNFASGKNITVSANEDNGEVEVSLNDVVTLGDGEDAIKIDGTNGTLNIGSTFAVAEDGTVLSDGDVIADADGEKYSLSEVGKYAVRYDKTNDGTSTITLADGDDLSGTRIKNVADGVDPKDAVNVSQLEAVEATANAGWTASDGTNSISIKPNETLNFVGDENLTVSADGTDKKLKVSLNDDITLGNTEAGNTEGERSFTINTTDPNGYVPESYKTGSGANFIEENGGFMLFATDTQGFGVFGVTAKGSAWARDFKTYTTDIYGNNTQYSLNEVGDAVAQMSSYYNGKNSYTVFSRYLNEAEKDNPFVTVDEDGNTINATRDIPLALRDDGAVLIGATIKGEDFTDNGIRINAETKTTYDKNGNEVTNNIATITGLENTEWKPPTPVATFAANDGSATVTSRAATESQLNDLYSAVAAYDVNVDGTIDYSHIALAGTPYGASRSGNGTHTGGTSITNVAYASGKDGSEAVNVDYLNDAINNAVKDGGAISDSDRHLQEGTYHVNDQGKVELIVADEKGENQSTVTIDNIANKNDITNLDNKIDNTFNDLNDKINNIDNVETDVKGGNINEDGTISLKTENEDGTTTNVTLKGQLTDSGVVQEGTSFDKETGTITITSQDKYSGKTSSVKVEGIASTEVVGATTKEDLADAYKDADKDGNATTAYITDSESMVEADVALDHAIQDVAGTSYANDMVLSNRIDSVEKRLGNVEERIDKVGAMAAAIANLRTMGFDPEAPTEIAIGVGQYKSETGIAIGVFHYPNQDFMLSASLSSSGDELMGGIGATWKLGRKSAAERAKDEEARHLEQAEEMKKLAQQEKVKAQAQRHAKLLAERQQASQKNA